MIPGRPMDSMCAARIAAPRMRARRNVRFGHDGFQALRQLIVPVVVSAAGPDMAEIDGEREEDPAFVIDAAQAPHGR